MILVTGPMSSGTRLLVRVLEGSGEKVQHDAHHGTHTRDAELVVAIVRDPCATNLSRVDRWPNAPFDRIRSIVGIAVQYPHALWVTYEHLCAHPDEVIAYVARRMGRDPWPVPEECVDQNDKWWSGQGGPPLGDPWPPS